jgi:uncharacterized protein
MGLSKVEPGVWQKTTLSPPHGEFGLRPLWQPIIQFNWVFALWLILLLGIPRFALVLQANTHQDYRLVPLVFMLMALTPFIFLTRPGRKLIRLRRPVNPYWLGYGFLLGLGACGGMCMVASLLFGDTMSNWLVNISRSYRLADETLPGFNRYLLFGLYALLGMTISPIGEELFYRGIVHSSLAASFGQQKASHLDSMAFALPHLAHFGWIYHQGQWSFLWLPALLWMLFMFVAAKLFFLAKEETGSLWGAITAHAGFNVAMTGFIFYHLF